MNEVLKLLREAEISVACLQDDNFESTKELNKDLEHISKQITKAIDNIVDLKKSLDQDTLIKLYGGK
tara:strand:+ start:86 stop:286 length:201 start_codon:yes stop_codon:yes gene_type:complete